MTKKATNPDLASLNLKATPAEEKDMPVHLARNVASNAQAHAGVAMQPWMKHVYGDIDLNELIAKLQIQTAAMKGGEMGDIKAMLFTQALTLQTMFTALSRRAALNAGEYMGATDTYMKLAFRAQAQCRCTLEALAEIKQPRSATFVRQANIAHTQQVHNGSSESTTRPRAPARDISGNQPNELITDERATHGNPMDTRSTAAASRSDSGLETVDTIDRT